MALLEVRRLVKHFARKQGLFRPPAVVRGPLPPSSAGGTSFFQTILFVRLSIAATIPTAGGSASISPTSTCP